MNRACLLLGSNVGKRTRFLEEAERRIELKAGKILRSTAVYETEPWGKKDQPAFLNRAILIETGLLPNELLKTVLSIETELGRVRDEKWAPRSIDVDILYYNDEVFEGRDLVIPHPFIAERKFTLELLYEINPEWVHPKLKLPIDVLLNKCEDRGSIKKFEGDEL